MSNRTTPAGKQGSESNATVSYEEVETGDPVTPVTDTDSLMLSKMVGEDDSGNSVRLATDSSGRVKVKDVQFDGTVDIGDLQVMNTSEEKIDPATEQTVSDLMKDSTFTETRTITDIQTGGSQTDELAVGINSDSAGIFKSSDFTESRNVRELQNESGIRSSDGYTAPGTTYSSLNSVSVPDGKTVVVEANGSAQNSGNIYVRDTTNKEKIVLRPGKSATIQIQDTGDLEWKGDNSGDEAQWFTEA